MKSVLITSCNTSSLQENLGCEKAFDGDVTARTGWSFNGNFPGSIVVNFETPVTINAISFKNAIGWPKFSIREFSVEVGVDGHFTYITNISANNSPNIQENKIKYMENLWEILLSFDQEEDITSVRITVHSTNPEASNGIITELYVLNVEDEIKIFNSDIDTAISNMHEGTIQIILNDSNFTIFSRVSKICNILKLL